MQHQELWRLCILELPLLAYSCSSLTGGQQLSQHYNLGGLIQLAYVSIKLVKNTIRIHSHRLTHRWDMASLGSRHFTLATVIKKQRLGQNGLLKVQHQAFGRLCEIK